MNLVFCDEMQLNDAPRRTSDGYMVAEPRIARTGVQEYTGAELGRPTMDVVRVYRPPEEVFNDAAMQSFAHRPVTIDHPPEFVDAKNWKQYARGYSGNDVVRDGEFVRVPMVLMDADAINSVVGGKAQISNGYSADLEWTPGVTPGGEQYDAVQRNIRGNHIAIVDTARGGALLRVYDAQPNRQEKNMSTKTMVIDGISVEVSDTAAQVIDKMTKAHDAAIATLKTAKTKAETELADAQTKLAAAQTENAELKTKLKDSELTPEKLDAAVTERANVVDKAKKVLPALVTDGKSVSNIQREVVNARLGDTAKDWTDAQVQASFHALTASINTNDGNGGAQNTGYVTVAQSNNDPNKAYQTMCDGLSNAYKMEGK